MSIDDLMQGITNQNLAQAELIKLRAENDALKARIKDFEEMKYDSGKWIPIKLAEMALEAQQKHFDAELERLKK